MTDISIQNLSNHSASDPTTNDDKMVESPLVNSLLGTDISNNDDHPVTVNFPISFPIDLSTEQTYKILIRIAAEKRITTNKVAGTNTMEEVSIVRRYEGEEIYEFTTGFPPRPSY